MNLHNTLLLLQKEQIMNITTVGILVVVIVMVVGLAILANQKPEQKMADKVKLLRNQK